MFVEKLKTRVGSNPFDDEGRKASAVGTEGGVGRVR